MIVFDGDSVVACKDFGVPDDKTWPALVAHSRGMPYVNLAKNERTAGKVLMRMGTVVRQLPQWYVLELGQWAHTHETPQDFERNLRLIVEFVRVETNGDTKICLMTPPFNRTSKFNPIVMTLIIKRIARIYKTELIDLFYNSTPMWFIADNSGCHFNAHGCEQVLEIFNEPGNLHICQP